MTGDYLEEVTSSSCCLFAQTCVGGDVLMNRWFGCVRGSLWALFPECAFKNYGQISLDWGEL